MKTVRVSKGEQVTLFRDIAIETSALCNRSCVFCPNHTTKRPDEYMHLDLINKMADELSGLRYNGRITTYIYNEPLRDHRLVPILEMLHHKVPRGRLMVSTNGDYLKGPKDIQRLLDAGVRQLLINIYSAGDGHRDYHVVQRGVRTAQKRHATIQKWVDTLPGISQRHSVYGSIPASVTAVRIEPKYGITSESTRLNKNFELQNRSGNIEWLKPVKFFKPLAKMCTRPFRMLNINWQGEALVCCNDYHGDVKIGNAQDSTLVELWNSPVLNKYRIMLQRKDRGIALCKNCDYAGGPYPHMVDTVKP